MATTQQRLEYLFRGLSTAKPLRLSDLGAVRKIAIVSTPRCGSSYFCEVLRQTGQFGWPVEWFNMRYVQAYGKVLGLTQVNFDQYFKWVLERTTTFNEVYSVNFHVEQYQHLLRQGLDVLKLGFDSIVYLHRRDKLAQAYSLRRAQITDQWSADTDPVSQADEKQLNRSEIIKAVYQIAQQEDFLEENLRTHIDQDYGYEDFTGDHAEQVFEDFLEIAGLEKLCGRLSLLTRMETQRIGYSAGPLDSIREYLRG